VFSSNDYVGKYFQISIVFQVAKTRPFLDGASQTVLPLSTVTSQRRSL